MTYDIYHVVLSSQTNGHKSYPTCLWSSANLYKACVSNHSFSPTDVIRGAQLASAYRMDTCMVDQEPHRSVQLIRRIDTRIPTPLLGQAIPSTPSLGKLMDLRSPVAQKGVVGLGAPKAATATTASATASSAWGGSSRVPSPLRGADTRPSTARACSAPGSEVPSSGRAWASPSPSVQAQRAQATAPETAVVPVNWEDDT